MIGVLKRSFHPMKFPWRFNDRSPFSLHPLVTESLKSDLDQLKPGFKQSYITFLNSLADQDTAALQDFSTPNLYTHFQECFLILNNRKHKLTAINTQLAEQTELSFFNEKIILEVPENYIEVITRSLDFLNSNMPSVFRKTKRDIIEIKQGEENRTTLKVDVLFNSPMKLIAEDMEGKLVLGENSEISELHLVQFEVCKRAKLNLRKIGSIVDLLILCFGNQEIDVESWVMSDTDNFIKAYNIR